MTKCNLTAFPAAMIAACEAALEADVFYQDPFVEFVVDRMGGYDCQAVLVEHLNVGRDDSAEAKELRHDLAKRVKSASRGHYGIVQRQRDDGSQSYALIVSDGTGELATGGRFDSHDELPTGAKVLERMVGYEIYLCRKAVEADRLLQSNVSALREFGFRPGMEFKDVKVSGETKVFAKAVVQSTNADTGMVSLLLNRRGSAKRWTLERGAKRLGEMVGLRAEEPNKHPPFVIIVPVGGDMLDSGETAA